MKNDRREKITNMTFREWRDLGYSTGTLHQLKKKIEQDKPFTLNQHVKRRMYSIGQTKGLSSFSIVDQSETS